MPAPTFVHLRVHSEYSIVDGLVRIDELVAAAEGDAQPAVALTDLSNLFGTIKLYQAARRRGIKPIIGCDVWISNEAERARPSRLLLFAKNRTGYLQLCTLLTRAWLENQVDGRAELRAQWLHELADGPRRGCLIALSGADGGDVGQALARADLALAEQCAKRWAGVFPDHFYLEVQRTGAPAQDGLVAPTVALAARLGLPVAATHPVQFLSAGQFDAHEARVCIAAGARLADAGRPHAFGPEHCFQSQARMAERFADLPQALANAVAIAQRCNVEFELNQPQLPAFPVPAGQSAAGYLESEAQRGLERRLARLYPDPARRAGERPRYAARLRFEVDTICKMQFPGYFLIVAEFIRWAKDNDVPVGPGRGSGAGSLVAYALEITDLDPLAYNLLFERFLNPERVSMPDFDIDFCQLGRDRVIQHVKDLYGKDAVSQIATFGTMAAKGAVRDVGRVLSLSYGFVDTLSRLIPAKPGKLVTIASALEDEPALAERQKNEPEVQQLLALAQQVEGITRNVGMHAGGVLIAPGKLTDFCPLYTQNADEGIVAQFDKDDVEAVGLVKFDFLGLTTLTVLDLAVRYVRQLDPALAGFRLDALPMDDTPTYELLVRGDTVAVFQLESDGMQGMLRDARPDRFEDIIALVALYRPGPMDLIPDFCRRKHGEPFAYPDPRTQSILSETYGIMVYQEQVMQMAQIVGGYTLGGADLLRRAMGKKKPEEMAAHRALFRRGAGRDGLSEQKADEIFDLMEKFAGYGFNKSHAAAYALLSYHTAYLKAHHPAAFMAANLSLAMDDTDKVKILVDDALGCCGLGLLGPDINRSGYRFEPIAPARGDESRTIRYGLGAVKGCGQNAIEHIIEVRSGAPFASLFDFVRRVDKRLVTRRTVESLIRAGAFDSLGTERAALLASVPAATEAAEQWRADASQSSLFGDDGVAAACARYATVAPWTLRKRLTEERTALGFCFSGNLFDIYAAESRHIVSTRLSGLAPSREPLLMAGVVRGLRHQVGARGKLVVATLDDGTACIDVTFYADVFEQARPALKVDEYLVVLGRVARDRLGEGLRVIAERVYDLERARKQFARQLRFTVPPGLGARALGQLLQQFRAADGLPLALTWIEGGAACRFALPDKWRVVPSEALCAALVEAGVADAALEY